MDETLWWIVDIIGAAVLLAVLVWLVMRWRSGGNSGSSGDSGSNRRTEDGTRDLYAAEEQRRREGTDDL